jgi:hypothetical protein
MGELTARDDDIDRVPEIDQKLLWIILMSGVID